MYTGQGTSCGHGKGTYHQQVGKEARLTLGPVRHPQGRLTLRQGLESELGGGGEREGGDKGSPVPLAYLTSPTDKLAG